MNRKSVMALQIVPTKVMNKTVHANKIATNAGNNKKFRMKERMYIVQMKLWVLIRFPS